MFLYQHFDPDPMEKELSTWGLYKDVKEYSMHDSTFQALHGTSNFKAKFEELLVIRI